MGRDLKILGEHCVEFTKYNPSCCTERETRVKRLVTEKEMQRAKEALENHDEAAIENFCYSIA